MAKEKKYYVVWIGKSPGIYRTWTECKEQIAGFPNAKYKSFANETEAKIALQKPELVFQKPIGWKESKPQVSVSTNTIIKKSISVDAACSGNPGNMEYRGVQTSNGAEIFHFGPVKNGTNNIGEFLAIVHGLALLKQKGYDDLPIYTDSMTAMAWVRKKKAKTTLQADRSNQELFDLIERAENWLNTNSYKNPLLKWETEHWGEIPADFGRKG